MANIYWVGGTGTWNTSSTTNWANASGGTGGTGTVPTATDNVFFDQAGAYTVTLTGALLCSNITVSAGTVTFTSTGTLAVSGSMSLVSATLWSATGTITFNSTSAQTISVGSSTMSSALTFDGVGGSWQLQNAVTIGSGRTVTLTNGTLDLNSNTLTTGVFSSTNTNTRTLAFGSSGRVVLTGSSTTIWTTQTVTNMSYSGNLNIDVTANASTGTRTIAYNAVGFTWNAAQLQANAANFRVMAGSDTVVFSARCGSVDFTGFSGTLGNGNLLSYGSIKFSPTMLAITPGTTTIGMFAETGSWTLQTYGLAIDRLVGFGSSATGTATYTLQDSLNVISGTSTGTVTLSCGTLNMNNYNITCGFFNTNTANTRTIAFGTGTIAVTDSGATAWNCTTATNLTTTGTGTISMTSATAKTFVGGGGNYAAAILDQGGAGALTITGSNTLANMTASIASTSAASILFTAGTTTTLISGFNVNGTAANLITISSATAAPHTLSLPQGTVVANRLNLSYSTATGGAAWYAGASTNGGNNTGWQFIVGTAVVTVGHGIAIGRGVVFS